MSVTAALSSPPPAVTVARDEALDFVKGSLVLVMVLYHWLNYFVTLDWDVYRYLRFLTPSFILITGYLVSRVYLAKYPYDSPRLRRRLMQRGAKLIVLFIALNILAGEAFAGGSPAGQGSVHALLDRANAVFITGAKAAAFNILVPIGYFLLLAPAVLLTAKRTGYSLFAIAAAVMALTLCADASGVRNDNVELVAIAFVGLAAGATGSGRLESILGRPAILVIGYLLYLAAITIWNVLYPLQVAGVCLSVALIYVVGKRWATRSLAKLSVLALGKYSLFAYVTQIAVLQVLRRGLNGDELAGATLALPFVATLVATLLAVQIMDLSRARWPVADRLYRTVFA